MPETTHPSMGRFRIPAGSEEDARRLGNQLRRYLLSEIAGMAATAVRIEGVPHEFQAVPGIREDVLDLMHNLKQVRVCAAGDAARGTLDSTSADVKAGELKLDCGEIANPDLVIAHTGSGSRLRMDVVFERGRGFQAFGNVPEGFLAVPARFNPVEKVGVKVEVDGLLITIQTDGRVSPASAIGQAAQELGVEFALYDGAGSPDPAPVVDVELGPEFRQDPFMGMPPALRDLNKESYTEFLETGIPKLLDKLFPLVGKDRADEGKIDPYGSGSVRGRRIDLMSHRLQAPTATPEQCVAQGLTYGGDLHVTLRVVDNVFYSDDHRAVAEWEVNMGLIPMMTDDGRFVFRGARRTFVMFLDRDMKARRIGDVVMQELDSLITRMKPVLEERADSVGWLHKEILDLLPFSATLCGLYGSVMCQYSDETNPLSLLTHGRRLSALHLYGNNSEDGPDPRLMSVDQFGRLDYLETPEGPNCGLIHSLGMYADMNAEGDILTPYRKVEKGRVIGDIVQLTIREEAECNIADITALGSDGLLVDDWVTVRRHGDILRVPREEVQFVSVSPVQALGFSSSLIPFLGHDDPNRALMGANMHRQAVAPISSEQPLVKTGVEAMAALASGQLVVAKRSGKVVDAMGDRIVVQSGGARDVYTLTKYERSHQAGIIDSKPIVSIGEDVLEGQVLADAAGTCGGEIAVGRNVLAAYMPFRGYNFEDAICISDELLADETFTSVSIEKWEVEVGDTEVWVAPIGSKLNPGDVLVQEASGRKRTLLVVPSHNPAVVVENGMHGGVIRMLLAEKRRAGVGDKLAGRHGNKGVIARVLPRSEMPYMEDGTPVQMILNTLGVISRMNLGQILEAHYGLLAHKLGTQVVIPPFMTPPHDLLRSKLAEAGLSETGMVTLYDGATGRAFESPVTVGWAYMFKLQHMVDDKMHAISTGKSSLITHQPTGRGGQRVGRLEMWALEAYNAGCTLQEFLTVKSDDAQGREAAAHAMLSGQDFELTGEGASLQLLETALRGLGISIEEER